MRPRVVYARTLFLPVPPISVRAVPGTDFSDRLKIPKDSNIHDIFHVGLRDEQCPMRTKGSETVFLLNAKPLLSLAQSREGEEI